MRGNSNVGDVVQGHIDDLIKALAEMSVIISSAQPYRELKDLGTEKVVYISCHALFRVEGIMGGAWVMEQELYSEKLYYPSVGYHVPVWREGAGLVAGLFPGDSRSWGRPRLGHCYTVPRRAIPVREMQLRIRLPEPTACDAIARLLRQRTAQVGA